MEAAGQASHASPPLLDVVHWGRTSYRDAHRRQQELVAQRLAGEIGDTLLLTEHDAVITLGRGTPEEEREAIRSGPIECVEVERGGEATWHGPGQLVAYPILLLEPERRDLHRYLRDLEQVVIDVLAEFAVAAGRRDGLTGVWVGERKICSIGVAVRRWCTWHGLALNLVTDAQAWSGFRPCGMSPDVMIALDQIARPAPRRAAVEESLARHFGLRFGYAIAP
jgi:lipoate-protein ligase B